MSAVLNRIAKEQESPAPVTGRDQRASGRLRLYHVSKRSVDWVLSCGRRVVEALHAGFWLGVLDSDQINEIVGRYYDRAELYRTETHNFFGFFPSEKKLIGHYFKDCRAMLVAATGAGREVLALVQAGVEVDGFDCNQELVEKCKEFLGKANLSARLFYAEPNEVPASLGQYDGAIIGFGAYAHIVGRSARIDFLRALKRHLGPGAPLLVSVGPRPEGASYDNWVYFLARAIRFVRGSANRVELGDDLAECFTHRFVESELRSELEEAGLAVIEYVETIYAVARA